VVHHPGACAVVATTPQGQVVLVRQTREAIRSQLLEIPAGVFDVVGEDGATCAARELVEETGYRSGELQPLATIYTSPGFTDERIELFLAHEVERGDGAGEVGVVVETPRFEDAVRAVREGHIVDAKTIVGLLLAAEQMRRSGAREGAAGV